MKTLFVFLFALLPIFSASAQDAASCGCLVLNDTHHFSVGIAHFDMGYLKVRVFLNLDSIDISLTPDSIHPYKGKYIVAKKHSVTGLSFLEQGNYDFFTNTTIRKDGSKGNIKFFPGPCYTVRICLDSICKDVVPTYGPIGTAYNADIKEYQCEISIYLLTDFHPLPNGKNLVEIQRWYEKGNSSVLQFENGVTTVLFEGEEHRLSFEVNKRY